MFWLLDYFINGNLSIGFVFIIYIWIVFLMRWLFSKRYKHYKNEHHEEITAIIPVYNENLSIFKKCLQSLKNEKPQGIIAVINGCDKNESKYSQAAKSFGANVYILQEAAKRPALVLGIKKARNKIILLLDSDTILKKGALKKLIKPFKDKKVGGVTSTQMIINSRASITRKFAGWMEDIRFAISQRAQSSFGAVGCLPGRFIAFRRKLLFDCLDDFVNQKFLGQPCTSGDDRYFTSHVLKKGYKTILQATSVVYTNCPDTFSGFLKQQLRWARSSQRETLRALRWLYRYPYTMFAFITDIITPFFFLIVEINIIYQLFLYGGRFINLFQFVFDITFALFAMNLSIGLKQMHHFKLHPEDILLLPLYSLFMILIMTPLRIWGFITMANPSWHTRSVIWTDGSSKKLIIQRKDASADL